MKKHIILRIAILVLFVLLILSSKSFAAGLGEWIQEAEDFISSGEYEAPGKMDTDKVRSGTEIIFNAFSAIGIGVVIIVGAILGIQFMTAGIEKKVEVKNALFPYIISCVILFGSYGIWKLVVTIMREI